MQAVCSGTRGRGWCGWSDITKPPEITAPTPLSTFRLTHSPTVSVSFGGPVIKSGDSVEQEKQLKYASLVANAVMLSNVADMTTALSAMDGDGHPVTPALAGCLSPYTREHIRRFGQYVLDMADVPPPLDPHPLPFEKA